mmetsp:Transcript_71235/g.112827  ORF Transcript_71235/g.112827 Transcript_71235/m.112827 type:complete len:361 (+) Transcript_71235:130-1212(+)
MVGSFSGVQQRKLVLHGTASSKCLAFPTFLVRFCGVAVGVTFILLCMKGDTHKELPWWAVLLPIIICLCLVSITFTSAILAWVYIAIMLMTGNAEVDTDQEVRLDALFRTAKVCFLGHGYVHLLILSLVLLLMKLSTWPTLPVVYPLLPLIVLGFVYVFLAFMFKKPEVDSTWFSFVGVSLLSQSIMLVMKFDHFHESKRLPWAATFIPSWLTFILLLVYCVLSPMQVGREEALEEDSRTAGSTHSRYGSMKKLDQGRPSGKFQTQLWKVAGIASWVIGWGLSLVLLTLRLDVLYKVSWLGVFLPALVGWTILLVFVSDLVSDYFRGVVKLLLETLGTITVVDSDSFRDESSASSFRLQL